MDLKNTGLPHHRQRVDETIQSLKVGQNVVCNQTTKAQNGAKSQDDKQKSEHDNISFFSVFDKQSHGYDYIRASRVRVDWQCAHGNGHALRNHKDSTHPLLYIQKF